MPLDLGRWCKPPRLERSLWLSTRMMDKLQPAIALQECASSFARSLNFKRSRQSVCEISQFLHISN